jgi:glucokinase
MPVPASYRFVCGDIGGTNARLELWSTTLHTASPATDVDRGVGEKEVLLGAEEYLTHKYPTLEAVIKVFLDKYGGGERVYCMCLAVAGPVNNNSAKITNLTWAMDGAVLARQFNVVHSVRIINDFVGIGYGLLALGPSELEVVHRGSPPDPCGVRAVIGAGTGLGECFLTHNGKAYDVWGAEGGHADFAPRNQLEFNIMEDIKKTNGLDRVSIERVTSGLGLRSIYEYLSKTKPGVANAEVAAKIRVAITSNPADVGMLIGRSATAGSCPICVETMDVFVSSYGAEAGNLCMKTLPFGGLYIAGGIAAKNMDVMTKNDQFVNNFLAKGRMKDEVLKRIPIYLITHKAVGLLGSKVICRRIVHEPTITPIRAIRAKL